MQDVNAAAASGTRSVDIMKDIFIVCADIGKVALEAFVSDVPMVNRHRRLKYRVEG